ncbi:hypothetical protein BG842_02955 [Haladaptatus sp. W1]|nr:hypothetical protein BG842_02955 [Haladaptatus sp. W1]
MMRTPDGHVELSKFITPEAIHDGSEKPAVNTLGFAVSCSQSTTSTKSSTASAPTKPNSWYCQALLLHPYYSAIVLSRIDKKQFCGVVVTTHKLFLNRVLIQIYRW